MKKKIGLLTRLRRDSSLHCVSVDRKNQHSAPALLSCYHSVVESIMCESFVALDARVP